MTFFTKVEKLKIFNETSVTYFDQNAADAAQKLNLHACVHQAPTYPLLG